MPLIAPKDIGNDASTMRISLADDGGWDLDVLMDGERVATEHFTDWHRLERRRDRLRTRGLRVVATAATALGLMLAIVTGASAQEAAGLLPEPRLLEKAVNFIDQFKSDEADVDRTGFYPELGNMITGAGWISLGPGYRHRLLMDQAVVDVSTALSWRAYKVAQARVEFPSLAQGHLALGSQVLWRDHTQVSYFGSGPASVKSARSDYRLQASDTVIYATVRSNDKVQVTTRMGWLTRPSISSSTGPFDRDLPDTLRQFSEEPGAELDRQPAFLHGTLALVSDTRDHRSHPSRGGLYRAAWVGFRDRDNRTFTFERYEAEGAQFVPLIGGRSVVALHGLAIFSSTAAGRAIPFYMLPSLGGANTLRGYDDYRFHDRNLLVVNAESRWALLTHVDAALFLDAGSVAGRAKDLDLSRTSYGVGIRLHTGASTIARVEAARSHEGWRFLVRLNDPLRLARLSRRTAAVPFVP
jgi:hypothetical protein